MMTETELRAQLAGWRNLGPFREIEDLRREMAAVADSMSDLDADVVAAVLVALAREDDSASLDALCDFLEFFARSRPRALGAALLTRLEHTGPPVLVEQIGTTDHPDAAKRLRERLDLNAASEPLLIALASTLGELRGDDAGALLEELAALGTLPGSVRDEIAIARRLRRSAG
jgi:hypothetical protein